MINSRERIKEFVESTRVVRDSKRNLDYDIIKISSKTIIREKIKGNVKGETVFVKKWDNPKKLKEKTNLSKQEIINRLKLCSRQEKLSMDKIKSSNLSLIKIHDEIPKIYYIAIISSLVSIFYAILYYRDSFYEFHVLMLGGLGTIIVSLIAILEVILVRMREKAVTDLNFNKDGI
jgi:hypothetical protein